MLVLSRQVDQEILIGNDISIKVTRIMGDQVRIGVKAPKGVLGYLVRDGEVVK